MESKIQLFTPQKKKRERQVARRKLYKNTTRQRSRLYREIFPSNLKTVLKYRQNISLDPAAANLGAGGSNTWVFSANGIYDPDITGTGHAPMYYDYLASVYQAYRVNFSKIKVTVVNHFVNTRDGGADTLNYSYVLGILNETSSTDFPGTDGMNNLIEERDPNFKYRYIGPALTGKLPSLSHKQVPYKLQNVSSKDDGQLAPIGSNAPAPTYYIIGITSADGNTNPPAVYLAVEIEYWVEFSLRTSGQSQN